MHRTDHPDRDAITDHSIMTMALPKKFRLTEAMRTEIEHLDEDHRHLVALVNSIALIEQAADAERLLAALKQFRDDLARHFEVEEEHLGSMSYPELPAHAKHHAQTLAALDKMAGEVANGGRPRGGIASTCYHELITVVLLRDMEFMNWIAGRRRVDKAS